MTKTPQAWARELLTDPGAISKLTTPQMAWLLEQLKQINISGGGPGRVEAHPGLMALRLSKGRWQMPRHLEMLSEVLADVAAGRRPRLLISMPPRSGKSLLVSYWFPLWYLARNPDREIIIASYEAEFAASWGRRLRDAVTLYGRDLGLALKPGMTAAHSWGLESGGLVNTAGVGGPITGKGGDLILVDDPIKNDEEAASEVMREKLWNWWGSTLFTRLSPNGAVAAIATRWHQDDLLGRLEAQSISGEGIPWEIINLPALADKDDPLGREPGEPLWPERWPRERLAEIEQAISPYHWSALYQGRPSPEEGGGVKRIWWKYYHVPPAQFDEVIQSWDLAFKDLKKSDFTVGQVWGRVGAEFYLLHQVRARMNAPEAIAAIRNMTETFPRALAKLIEDKANGPAVVAMLHKEVAGIVPVKVRGSKSARLSAVTPLIMAGNVYIPHPSVAPWSRAYVEECAAFPNGTNDDQVDATTQALSFLQPNRWAFLEQAHGEAKVPRGAGTTEEMLNAEFSRSYHKLLKRSDKKFRKRDLVLRVEGPR